MCRRRLPCNGSHFSGLSDVTFSGVLLPPDEPVNFCYLPGLSKHEAMYASW